MEKILSLKTRKRSKMGRLHDARNFFSLINVENNKCRN